MNDREKRRAAWRHVAAVAIIRRLVEGSDPEAVSAGLAFIESEHPTPDEYMQALVEEQQQRMDDAARRMAP